MNKSGGKKKQIKEEKVAKEEERDLSEECVGKIVNQKVEC